MPRISVIIPSYNHEKYVAEAIHSVLEQTFQDFEIIITDDGSSDRTVDVIRKFTDPRIRLFVFDKNQGACVATNNCIQHTSGEYIAMLSSDDVFLPDKLEKQIRFLDEHKECAAVFSYAKIIDERGHDFTNTGHFYYSIFNQPNRTRHEWLHYFFYNGNCLCHPSALIRKECYTEIGTYDPRFAQQPDFDFWIRLCLKYNIHIIPEKLIEFRVLQDSANASGDKPEVRARLTWELHEIIKNYLSIKDISEFSVIFPETRLRFGNAMESDLIPYYLAMLAFDNNYTPYQIAAMDILFELLGDRRIAERIGTKYSFRYTDLYKLTGNKNPRVQEYSARLYIDTGNGFNEKESISVPVNAEATCLEFDLHAMNKIIALRFDPLEDFVVLKIKSIQIENKEGMQSVNPYYYSLFQKDGVLFSKNADPFILMAPESFEKPSKITFYLEYLLLGTQAVENIELLLQGLEKQVNELKIQVDDFEKQVYEIKNSNGWKIVMYYYRLRDGVLPAGSWRRSLVKLFIIPIKAIKNIFSLQKK